MLLAMSNLLKDRTRFLVAVFGIGFASFLMTFQVCLLLSFLQSASRIVEAADADLWITPRGVTCFDFPATLEQRYSQIAQGFPGISSVSRMSAAFAEYRKPDGSHQTVALVGMDGWAGDRLPHPFQGLEDSLTPDAVAVDSTTSAFLGISTLPGEVEINGKRARVVRVVRGFSSFLGSPYVFAEYNDAARYIRLPQDRAMFVLLRIAPGYDVSLTREQIQRRLPNLKVWTREEFKAQCRRYWLSQTGAGGTILTSAVLGFLIGLAIVSQTMYAITMDNLEEFATLRALGAPQKYIAKVVLLQSLTCGMIGCSLAAIITFPLVDLARIFIPWATAFISTIALMALPTLGMCILASLTAVRAALTSEPAKVFRA
jgi:putative ABC transport system permease protein